LASLSSAGPVALLALVAALAAVDLQRVESQTLVVYTTPALQDFMEKAALPAFTNATGIRAVAVYLPVADEYVRVRLSRERPEADVFVHASPLYLAKGATEGLIVPHDAPAGLAASHHAGAEGGGNTWSAFAWSPLVEVYPTGRALPDLATGSERVGLAHPLLSNNGVYVAVLFEEVDPEAGRSAVGRTVVQPTNARATIGGVADGSYDVTLGYEAVATFFQARGAKVAYDLPVVRGERITTPVLFSAGLVRDHPHAGAEAFLASLFEPALQARLASFGFRPVLDGAPQPAGALDLSGARSIDFDWSRWQELEARLSAYEVKQ
jgi:ABC-type molybdate transport system substrate-binding protein